MTIEQIKYLANIVFNDTYVLCNYSNNKFFISIIRGVVKINDKNYTYIFDDKKYDLNGDEVFIDIKNHKLNYVIPILYDPENLFNDIYYNGEYVNPIIEYAKNNISNLSWEKESYILGIRNTKCDLYIYLDEFSGDIVYENDFDDTKTLNLNNTYDKYHIINPKLSSIIPYKSVDELEFNPYSFK